MDTSIQGRICDACIYERKCIEKSEIFILCRYNYKYTLNYC